jgi:hypothetical protein
VDASIWPFFDQARAIEKNPSLIPATGVPFYEGLQLWHLENGTPVHREYGRVEDRRIGERRAGRAIWTTVGLDGLEPIALTTASFTGGWPDDAATTQAAIAEALDTMGRRGAWEDLGLMWASERFLGVYWPRIVDAVRDRLASRTWSTGDELYPAQDSNGALFLADTRSLAGMRLFSPGTAGFAEFLRLAAVSTYTVSELRAAARLWWERPIPADFRPARPLPRPSPARPQRPHTPRSPSRSSTRIRRRCRSSSEWSPDSASASPSSRCAAATATAWWTCARRDTDRIFTQIPVGTLLTTVSLRSSGKQEDLGDYAELKQAIRDRGRPQEQYREIRRHVSESIDEIAADEQPRPQEGRPRAPRRPPRAQPWTDPWPRPTR